jgi:8-oxo-dGTP diphosphatase
MSHIHTQPGEHDFTASAYIVTVADDQPRLLLHMHRKLGIWLQYGGHVELTETPWQTIQHEIPEESGYDMSQLLLIQPPLPQVEFSHANLMPWPVATLQVQYGDTDHRHIDIAYAFTTTQQPAHAVGENESNTLTAFSRQELADLPDALIPDNVRELGLFILDTCLPSWQQIPAADWPG